MRPKMRPESACDGDVERIGLAIDPTCADCGCAQVVHPQRTRQVLWQQRDAVGESAVARINIVVIITDAIGLRASLARAIAAAVGRG